MENENQTYRAPYVGCLLGSAFQKLTGQLEATLKREKLGITSAEYMILRALYSRDGLQQCEIAEMVGKDKASISRSIAALAKKDLVKTECVSYKCNRIWLTDKAIELQPTIMRIADERHAALIALSSENDIEVFRKVLLAILK